MYSKKAFTLVELLVVIAIISVLAAMLMPALENALESAWSVSCVGNVRQLAVAHRAYGDEFNEYIPVGYKFSGQWHRDILPYVDMEDEQYPSFGLWKCPTNDNLCTYSGFWNGKPTASYGQNYRMQPLCADSDTPDIEGAIYVRFDMQKFPSKYIIMADTAESARNFSSYYSWFMQPSAANLFSAHTGGGNVAWMDIHVTRCVHDDLIGDNPWLRHPSIYHSWSNVNTLYGDP